MAKGNALKFIEGAAAGVTLGVAAALFLNSKAGKKITNDLRDHMADFYKYIAPKVKKMQKMGQAEYKAFMKSSAEQYVKARKITGDTAQDLIKEAQKSWHHFSKHLGNK